MGQTCGILPIGVDSARVKTRGLKWDFGECARIVVGCLCTHAHKEWDTSIVGDLSTSNHLVPENPTVWIETDKSILWTAEIPPL